MAFGRGLIALIVIAGGSNLVPAQAETIQVVMEKVGYAPESITAKVGDTIEWVNKDLFAHTATVRGDWDVVIQPNKSGSTVMKKAGEIDYICRFHPNMKGHISVK